PPERDMRESIQRHFRLEVGNSKSSSSGFKFLELPISNLKAPLLHLKQLPIDGLIVHDLPHHIAPARHKTGARRIDGEIQFVRMGKSDAIDFLEFIELFDEQISLG